MLRKEKCQSGVYRELGNKKYGLGDSEGALALYSQAVLTAPHSEPELSLALANRSAALLSLNNHRAAVQDIEMALSEGYPKVTNIISDIQDMGNLYWKEIHTNWKP